MATRTARTRPARFDRAGRDQLIDITDLHASLPGLRRLRDWAHAALDLRPGETAVDIGSGTGSEVFSFADAVGASGEAIGVEPDPSLLASAQRRGGELGSSARFLTGDAYRLPLPDASVDAVLCERVFQHLTMPDRAAREITRVLRPGGRVVVVDADWGTAIVHPGDPAVTRAVIDTLVDGTTTPYSGRQLSGWLTTAGMTVVDIGSHAVVQDPSVGAGALVAKLADLAVARLAITPSQRTTLLADLADAPHTHVSVTMFAVVAQR
jgi:ubiquinone/menaquinone biosynthesis C-methylase UbiE